MPLKKLFLILCVLAWGIGVAWGQGPVGTLTGTVTDKSGAVVPGASVVVKNAATGVETRTTATGAGAYTVPYLPAGAYNITVMAPGFRPAEYTNVRLRTAQTLNANFELDVGGVTETVTITDTPPLLESGSAEIGRYISTEEYKSWPIVVGDGQRQIQDFIFNSLPGTTGETWEGSINGGQNYSHEILIEGVPVGRSDLSGGNNSEFSPSAEAVGEFKLQAGAVSAQYNGGQTAVANFAIKSGTNDLHGSGFYYMKNEALNSLSLAQKTQGQKKSRYRENNEGFSLGGPVYIPRIYNGKNKTFFFVNFEKDHYDQLGFSGFATLPTLDMKKGDFSKLLDPSYTGNASSGSTVTTDALGRAIAFGAIYDPKTTRTGPDGQPIRDPFAGNIIPQNRFDPVAVNILNLGIVDPTRPTLLNNIDRVSGCCPYFDLHSTGVKIDHNISDRHQFSAYYNHSYRNRQQNSGGSGARYMPIPGPLTTAWKYQLTPGRMARASLNSTLAPTLINRVAAGFNRFYNQNGARPETIDAGWAEKLGIMNTSDAYFPTFTFSSGTQYQGSTLSQIGSGGLYPSANGSWVLNDDLTWVHGKHTAHFGYQYTRYYYNERNPDGSGAFRFSPIQTDAPGYSTATGHSFASFLMGGVLSASRGINPLSDGVIQPQHAFYAMDDWKVTPRLTLNAGLRWEIIPPFHERTGRISYIDLGVPNPGANNLPGALVFGKSPNQTYWKQFGPRLGFAYQATSKMVVRAGYAILSTPPIRNDWGYGGFTYGYNAAVNVRARTSPTGFADDPAMYLSQPFPSFGGTLPVLDPDSGNFDASQTSAPDANRPAYTQNWNVSIQYQLPRDTVLEVAYIGNKGTRLWGGQYSGFGEMNGIPSTRLAMGDTLNAMVEDYPEYMPYASFPGSDFTVAQALRPYPQYSDIYEAFPYNTNSLYNSLQVTVTRHLTEGLGFIGAYTWSKTLGYVDGAGPGDYYVYVQDFYNRKLERSIALFNYPHNLKLTWVYDLPFGKGKRWDLGAMNYAIGGWQFAAIQGYHSGSPLTVGSSGLNTPVGFGSIRPDIVAGQPLTLGPVPKTADYLNGTPYVNPDAFQNVPMTDDGVPLRVGTAPRVIDGLRGPRFLSEQFRMSKKFPIKERATVGFGVTAINPFNRVSLRMGSMTVGDSDFGTVYANGSSRRTVQLDLRVEF